METTEQEFTYLIEKHKSVIYTVCLMFSKDRDDIDDMFQEILIKLWNGYEKFRGESDVKTWIYRVSLNCCLNQQKIRRLKQESTRELWNRHPEWLCKHFWKERTFWSDGYFVCSIGEASPETVRRYIENQG